MTTDAFEVVDAGPAWPLGRGPCHLGARLVPGGADVGVVAPHATGVEVCLLDDPGTDTPAERRYRLHPLAHGRWGGHVPGMAPGQRYGFRVSGPWEPQHGHRHNPNKLLLDPYARGIDGELRLVPEVYATAVDESLRPTSDEPDPCDSAAFVPHSVLIASPEPVPDRPHVPWHDTVIYEAHVKGLTMRLPGVPDELRGTYAGLAHPVTIGYLQDLGVTTIELLPIFAKLTEPALTQRGAVNYWGYNTAAFFAPEPSYATQHARQAGPAAVLDEVRRMVAQLHDAGLEVLLDVVYNHTAEGPVDGPMLCWRGLDNAGYYLHSTATRAQYLDVTGTGNSLDFRTQHVVAMTLDSMRYWVQHVGVDGFRLDLAVTLGRNGTDFDPRHPTLTAMATDPVLSGIKQIAEPWDIGPEGWRTGQFAAPMVEWNDRFRDVVRDFWLSDVAALHDGGHGQDLRDLATRLAGSADLFAHTDIPGGRGPTSSVNFITAHDGFTLADLVAYEVKHNWPNGEGNHDGSDHNRSFNHGVEGRTDDAEILRARRRAMRALLGTLLMSAGTPMLTAGDEIGRTQAGNNNAYALDDESVWVEWELQDWQHDLLATTTELLRLRREHPVLRPEHYTTSATGDQRDTIAWFRPSGEPMHLDDWHNPGCRAVQMLRRPSLGDTAGAVLVINGTPADQNVTLAGSEQLRLAWDSSWENPREDGPALPAGSEVSTPALSLQVYVSGSDGN